MCIRDSYQQMDFQDSFFNTKIGGHKMTINLSETFANAKNEFINAVNNGCLLYTSPSPRD
ncbi:hypothetical protein JMUB7538_27320 [Staphylococcus aureus]